MKSKQGAATQCPIPFSAYARAIRPPLPENWAERIEMFPSMSVGGKSKRPLDERKGKQCKNCKRFFTIPDKDKDNKEVCPYCQKAV